MLATLGRESGYDGVRQSAVSCRLRVLAVALSFWLLTAVESSAQGPDVLPRCYYTDEPGTVATYALPTGYMATLQRSAEARAIEDACDIRITGSGGIEVFRQQGYGTSIHQGTGRDLDGDGIAEAVIGTDSGGGNRCCWAYTVLRLGPSPRPIAELNFAPSFHAGAAGATLLSQTQAFYDLGPSMAQSPTVERVHRFERGQLVEVTRRYCVAILAPDATEWPARREVWELLTIARKTASRNATRGDFAVEETRVAAMSLALQQTLCGQPAAAEALVAEVWPAGLVATIRARVADAARVFTAPPK